MSRQSGNDWAALIGGIAQLAVAGGVAYAVMKARENGIEALLAQPAEEAIQTLVRDIPGMDTETWETFFQYLERKAQVDRRALHLLHFSVDVRRVTLSIEQLLASPLQHARSVLDDTAGDMDDATWEIFEYILKQKSRIDLTARYILNHAVNVRDITSSEERFRSGIKEALADNIITSEEATELEKLRQALHISPEVARNILLEVKATRQVQQDKRTRFLISPPKSSK